MKQRKKKTDETIAPPVERFDCASENRTFAIQDLHRNLPQFPRSWAKQTCSHLYCIISNNTVNPISTKKEEKNTIGRIRYCVPCWEQKGRKSKYFLLKDSYNLMFGS